MEKPEGLSSEFGKYHPKLGGPQQELKTKIKKIPGKTKKYKSKINIYK